MGYFIKSIKCEKCKKEANHTVVGRSNPHCDIFTECIYKNGELRWAGSLIGHYYGREIKVICSNCGAEYIHKEPGHFQGDYDFIKWLKERGHLILSKKNKALLKECNIVCEAIS